MWQVYKYIEVGAKRTWTNADLFLNETSDVTQTRLPNIAYRYLSERLFCEIAWGISYEVSDALPTNFEPGEAYVGLSK